MAKTRKIERMTDELVKYDEEIAEMNRLRSELGNTSFAANTHKIGEIERDLLRAKERLHAATSNDRRRTDAALYSSPMVYESTACSTGSSVNSTDSVGSKIKLTPSQVTLARFFAPDSDRRSLLLFHDVGVGKTCTAIQIAERYARDGIKVVVIAPRAVIGQFGREIYNRDAPSGGCLGDGGYKTPEAFQKRYTLCTIHHIFKIVDKIRADARAIHMSDQAREFEVDARVRSRFSNTLFVVDEVHKLRDTKEEKASSETLVRIARCTVNSRMLLMSATPMYNDRSEILWILNLMRTNDKRPRLDERNLTTRSIAAAAEGYVSRVRRADDDPAFPKQEPVSNFELDGLELFASRPPPGPQLEALSGRSRLTANNAHNVFFPPGNAFSDVFEVRRRKGVQRLQYAYVDPGRPIFSGEALATHACKLRTIVDAVLVAETPTFIFSELLEHGIIPLAIALEHAGYRRYAGPSLLVPPSGQDSGKRYIMLCGEPALSDSFDVLRQFNRRNNADGSIIGVVLGSLSVAEGVDLRNVGDVHVMEPWWHMNRIRQIIGRAVRRCSHPHGGGRVRVWLHACVADSLGAESSYDLYRYKIAAAKSAAIEEVENALGAASIESSLSTRFFGTSFEVEPQHQNVAAVDDLIREACASRACLSVDEACKACSKLFRDGTDIEKALATLLEGSDEFRIVDGATVASRRLCAASHQIREFEGRFSRPSCERIKLS